VSVANRSTNLTNVVRVGRLDVVATPIGNLSDLSARARESLAEADVIAVEDTRRSGQLLAALGIQKPLISLHSHNEHERGPDLLARLKAGEVIALISDAGTPLLCDPGFNLVRLAAAAQIQVRTIPGPTAIAAALSIAAIPADRFCFEGFLPTKPRERRIRLAELAHEPRTLVFFEAPHRIAESLADCAVALGETRAAAVTRELTKIFESVYRGSLAELAQRAAKEPEFCRGEITLVISGEPQNNLSETPDDIDPVLVAQQRALLERVISIALDHLPASKAAAMGAAITGVSREVAYALAVEFSKARR